MLKYVSGYILRNAPYNNPLSKPKTLSKYIGTAWQFVIHVSMSIFELYVLYDEPWLTHTYTAFEPIPQLFTVKQSLRIFFITQISIWVYTCYSHRFNSDAHAHKDYFVMYIHHLATIGLVGLAYTHNYHRVGIIVLFVHDVSDIGVDLLKLSNYLKLEGPSNFFIVEIAYTLCITLWGYFRLYLFPVEIIMKSTIFAVVDSSTWLSEHGTHSLPYMLRQVYGAESSEYTTHIFAASICNVLLIVLQVLHVWWGALLLRILYRMLTSNNPHEAGEEEYEGASDGGSDIDKND